ncbi:MAG: tetratricopeptide repeat protein [Candidatus Binataceae bacterium]
MSARGTSTVNKWMAALLIATALVYAPSLGNKFVYDDYYMILVNRYLGDWSFPLKSLTRDAWWFLDPQHLPQSAYYRPLADIWLWINYRLFGLNPIGWHAAMIVLHLLAVWLVYRVTASLTGDDWAGFLAAGLFALMPLHAGAAAIVGGSDFGLAAVFELAAFELYLGGGGLAAPLGLFAGALLCQESAIVFPALIAAHGFLLEPNRPDRTYKSYNFRTAFAAAWPYALVAGAYLCVRLLVLGIIYRPNLASEHPLSLPAALWTIPGALMTYLTMPFAPWRAGPAHSLAIAHTIASAAFYVPAAELAAICAAGIILLPAHPHRRLYLFCAAWFLIALGPVLNLRGLPAERLIQDRYAHFASIGLCIIAADAAVLFARRGGWRMRVVWIAAGAVAAVYAVALLSVERYWHDERTMFTRCVEAEPDSDFWRYRLGVTLQTQGDLKGARRQLEAAIKLAPNYVAALHQLAMVDDDLGDYKAAESVTADWLGRYQHPSVDAYTALATAATKAGDETGAEAALAKAAALPGGAEAVALTWAQLLLRRGRNEEAGQALKLLLKQNPNDPAALATIGLVYAAEHRYDDALSALKRAAALTPPAPLTHYRIALLLHQLGRDREARTECALVLAAAPNAKSAQELMAALKRSAPK